MVHSYAQSFHSSNRVAYVPSKHTSRQHKYTLKHNLSSSLPYPPSQRGCSRRVEAALVLLFFSCRLGLQEVNMSMNRGPPSYRRRTSICQDDFRRHSGSHELYACMQRVHYWQIGRVRILEDCTFRSFSQPVPFVIHNGKKTKKPQSTPRWHTFSATSNHPRLQYSSTNFDQIDTFVRASSNSSSSSLGFGSSGSKSTLMSSRLLISTSIDRPAGSGEPPYS